MDENSLLVSKYEDIKKTIISLEKQALEQWNSGNPDRFLEMSSDDVIYMDPSLEHKLVGKKALEEYYNAVRGKINIKEYSMINPVVQMSSTIAVLIYDYEAKRNGAVFNMHCTEVYRLDAAKQWKISHTHWSFVQII